MTREEQLVAVNEALEVLIDDAAELVDGDTRHDPATNGRDMLSLGEDTRRVIVDQYLRAVHGLMRVRAALQGEDTDFPFSEQDLLDACAAYLAEADG